MKWTSGDRSNIEDARGSSGGMGIRAGGLGLGGLLLVLVLSWATGIDFLSLVGGDGAGAPPSASVQPGGRTPDTSAAEEKVVDMVDAVMDDAQATWQQILGSRYRPTTAVLFRDAYQSACGFAQSATGPFYCPADHKVYLDLGFFAELQSRFAAPGDFARAYVIAHELGHHVQSLMGTDTQVRRAQSARPDQQNALSVALELQADCYAGVWGHHAAQSGGGARRVTLETGDVEAGLRAAAAIGDDRIQRMQTGRVAPDRFTHGSSEQRVTWFRRGLESGDPKACDTFK
jgi:predicted metalloprotease